MFEEHKIETEDGYILSLHRIPRGLNQNSTVHNNKVVLLAPCLLASSAIFTIGPRNNSLAYLLADRGKTKQ